MDRMQLCCLPTPLHRLERLNLRTEIWIKRDDLTGFALGGNKGRKLEYLVADWVNRGLQDVVTCGASDSNFIRQLAVAGQMVGIQVHAAVMDFPFDSVAGCPLIPRARGRRCNEQLSLEAGANLAKEADGDWEVLYGSMERIWRELKEQGRVAEIVPVGGSSIQGVHAFVQAAKELTQMFDTIVVPSSSGSTQVGLSHAFRGTETRVIGISADPEPTLVNDFAELSQAFSQKLDIEPLTANAFNLDLRFVGPGYGVPSEQGAAAQKFLLEKEGIYLDPIYTAKAFAGLLQLETEGELGTKALFWHTGGLPSLFTELV